VPRKGSHTQSSVTEAYLAALLNHPNIVHHHQTFIHDGTLVVASEYCMVRHRHTTHPHPQPLAGLGVSLVIYHEAALSENTRAGDAWVLQLGDLQTLIDAAIHMKLKFTAEMVMAVLVNLCKGVAWMHHNSVAHRDIKPENVFLDSDGVPKVHSPALPPATRAHTCGCSLTPTRNHLPGLLHACFIRETCSG
jgi:serine/threonine protein kinase